MQLTSQTPRLFMEHVSSDLKEIIYLDIMKCCNELEFHIAHQDKNCLVLKPNDDNIQTDTNDYSGMQETTILYMSKASTVFRMTNIFMRENILFHNPSQSCFQHQTKMLLEKQKWKIQSDMISSSSIQYTVEAEINQFGLPYGLTIKKANTLIPHFISLYRQEERNNSMIMMNGLNSITTMYDHFFEPRRVPISFYDLHNAELYLSRPPVIIGKEIFLIEPSSGNVRNMTTILTSGELENLVSANQNNIVFDEQNHQFRYRCPSRPLISDEEKKVKQILRF